MTLKTIALLDIIDIYRKLYPITAAPDYAQIFIKHYPI